MLPAFQLARKNSTTVSVASKISPTVISDSSTGGDFFRIEALLMQKIATLLSSGASSVRAVRPQYLGMERRYLWHLKD